MVFLKVLFILASVILMMAPLALEFLTFRRDKKKKITYKRLRLVIYTLVYVIAVTIALYLLKEFVLRLTGLSFIRWIANLVALNRRIIYFGKVMAVIIINFIIGLLYRFFSKFVRIGLKKKDLITPKKKNGEFNWRQKLERKVIKFFHTETWFFVGNILKYLSIVLTVTYGIMFVVYQVPAIFGANWIPYNFISMLFSAGYIYPMITLLVLWEVFFFLEGIKRLEDECPEILTDDAAKLEQDAIDFEAIDAEVRKQFKDYYVCDIDLSKTLQEEITSSHHHEITKFIGHAVENDKRNPQKNKEIYLNCLDKIIECDESILINGSFFSEFSMYFLRLLSVIVARGDNIVFVCNNDLQIEEVYQYLQEGFSQLSSLYCKGFRSDAIDYDDPVWRIVKISGEIDVIEEAAIDDHSILVTSLSYLCSADFESNHRKFIHLLDTVVFVDVLKTVNSYNRQLAMLNTRFKYITKNNALLSKNARVNKGFNVRYMSKQVRYICFDDTRTPGLDKVLKNLLAVEFDSADAMNFNLNTIVRCYNYEGRPDETGRRVCPQFIDSDEEIGPLMNIAVLCLAKGASNVTIFADDSIPYANIEETISANMGRVSIKADGSNIHLNSPFYNPDDYSVLIAMDSGDNLPAVLRRYISQVSDKPTLIIVFSRPYMMRDYYVDNIDEIWSSTQIQRIPVEEGIKKDIAQRILIKANAGGISEENILMLASNHPQWVSYVQNGDINSILREVVLEIQGSAENNEINLFDYFEYSSTRDFDENGVYSPEDKVLLRRQGTLFDMINGRDMVIMSNNGKEIVLPLPRMRLTQNYIVGQNMLHNGNIYHINRIDTASGRVYTHLATGGKNVEAYQYIQDREYRVELNPEQIETVFPTKHVILNRSEEDISVNDVYISVFRAPTEVITKGYFEVDPHTLAVNSGENKYHNISEPGNDSLAKQTYRRYDSVTTPLYSSDTVIESTDLVAEEKGAQMMLIRISGQFGSDKNKTVLLAAVMLNELLRSMFPSVSDSVVVCPVLQGEITDEESQIILQKQPKITIIGENELFSSEDFELLIIEDCSTDLGVISVFSSAGDNVLNTLFNPIFNYLKWYLEADEKSAYLYYGLDHEPTCFDFASLYKISTLLGDDKHDLNFIALDSVMEYAFCDFCGKRYAKGDDLVGLDDGRKMCKSCAENLVGYNKKNLKAHLDSAKIFLESTYGITLGDDYEFCFESTIKIANTLKQNRNLIKRGSDIPLKSYVDEKKKVHIEYSIPSVNLSELLVRELTYTWQLKHLPDLAEDLAEGHIALVAIQYLRFLNQNSLATVRTRYYESTGNSSGEGYRKLVRELLLNPQFNNNPFRYLLEQSGTIIEDEIIPPGPRIIETGDYGLPYTPEQLDRVSDGHLNYFYYSRLTATCQKAYDVLLSAIQNHENKVVVEGCTFSDIEKVTDAIEYDHPELFWYKNFSMAGAEVNLFYGASAEEVVVLQKRIDEVVPKYLNDIDDSMSAYDVALRIHVKVIASVDYDTIALNKQKQEGGPVKDKIDYLRTICGVFLDGKAVCEGYARAVQYLLQKCGVECAEVAGYIRKETGERGEAHAWNILKIDGDYYHLDTTWDDSSNTVQTVNNNDLGFDYFCITTDEITRTRDVDLCPTEVPNCDAIRGNYYYHNDLVLDSYDLNKIKLIAQNAAENQSKSFIFKCKTKSLFDRALSQLCAVGRDCYDALKAAAKINRQIRTNTYSYSYDKNIWTITVKFKFK
ncbi:MAG TPA: hypothetical protein GXZ43_06205 [Clostridiaceae bacterium]|nr:hypothetical protein [Clostridiaceae bacterium]